MPRRTFDRLRAYLSPPAFEDDEQARVAALLTTLTRVLFPFTVLITAGVLLLIEPASRRTALLGGLAVLLSLVATHVALRARRLRLASLLLPSSLCVILTASLANVGAVNSPATFGYLLIIAIAGLALGANGAVAFSLICNLAAALLFYAETTGWIRPAPPMPTLRSWVILTGLFSLTGLLLAIADRHIHQSLEVMRRLHASERSRAEESHRHARELAGLYETALAIVGVLDTRELLRRVHGEIERLLNPDSFGVVFYHESEQEIEVALAMEWGRPVPEAEGKRLPVSDAGLTGWVLRERRALLVRDLETEPLPALPKHLTRPARSWLGVPLLARDRPIGAVSVQSFRPNAFDEADQRFLQSLAGQMAVTIENARLFEAARRRSDELEAVRQATLGLTSSLDLHAVLDAILENTRRIAPKVDNAHIFLYDEGRLTFGAAYWDGARRDQPMSQPRPEGLTYSVARSGEMIVVPDIQTHPLFENAPREWRGAIVGLPLKIGERVVGVMNVSHSVSHPIAEADLRVLRLLGDQAAIAIENARLFEDVERQRRLSETLRDVAEAINSTLDIQQALERVLDGLARVIDYDSCAIFLVEAGCLRVMAGRGFADMEAIWQIRSPIETDELYAEMKRSLRPIILHDAQSDPRFKKLGGAVHVRGWIGVPLISRGEVIGTFTIDSHTPGAYGPREAAIAMVVGAQAATAIVNARLYAEARARADEFAALARVGEALTRAQTSEEMLSSILEEAVKLVTQPRAEIILLDPQSGILQIAAQIGLTDEEWRAFNARRYRADQGTFAYTIGRGEILEVADIQTDPRVASPSSREHYPLTELPLKTTSGTLGVIALLGLPRDDRARRLLRALADVAAAAIEKAGLLEETRQRAWTLAALHATSLDITGRRELSDLLQTIVERATLLLDADGGGLYLCYPERREARLTVAYKMLRDFIGVTLKYGEGAAGTVALTGRPLIVDDYRAWPGRAIMYEEHTQPLTAILAAPMTWQGRVTGVIDLVRTAERRRFTSTDLELLTQFAGQAAIAVENARLLEETQRRAEEQRLLFTATRDFGAGLNEDEVLSAIARHMTEALRVWRVTLSIWDREHDRVVTMLDHETGGKRTPRDAPGTAHALRDYPARRQVLESRTPLAVTIDDSQADPAERQALEKFGYSVVLMLPLSNGERVFGLIELFRLHASDAFTASDLQLAQSLAAQAAVALENARLHRAVIERARELDALLKANEVLLSTLDLEPLLQNVLSAAIAAIAAAEKGTILLTDPNTGRLQIRAIVGYTDPRVKMFTFAESKGYSARVARERRPLLIPDARADVSIRYNGDIPEVREILSAIAAPLIVHDRSVGVISLDSTRRAAFVESDLRLLVAFANTAAAAIDNARLHAEVQTLAVTDALTGLSNRRAFDRSLETEVVRAARYTYPLSLIIADLDNFKVYNDTFGHPAGDERLKAIAALLRNMVRDPDLVARYGGEEFALIVPHTDKEGALALAERIRAAAEAAAPARTGGAEARGAPIAGYTLSLGVASFPEDADSTQALLIAADNAELMAKRTGKNRVHPAGAER